jgi:hypothetical protein
LIRGANFVGDEESVFGDEEAALGTFGGTEAEKDDDENSAAEAEEFEEFEDNDGTYVGDGDDDDACDDDDDDDGVVGIFSSNNGANRGNSSTHEYKNAFSPSKFVNTLSHSHRSHVDEALIKSEDGNEECMR